MKVADMGVLLGGTALAVLLLAQVPPAVAQGVPPADADWRADWELADGLTMQIDTAGYSFPSHIVFVPDPGSDPRDALYFVVELKGQVKVVANDRSVHTFARDILPNPQGPTEFNQVGLTGLCLDPERGYVFTTFAYLQGLLLPAGQHFKRKLSDYFSQVRRSETVWFNLPPAFVYRCRR